MTAPICPYCGKPAVMATGDEVYSQRLDLDEKRFWCCWPCDARVGCHPGTRNPLGTLANAPLRRLRNQVHALFDPFWKRARKQRGKERRAAYARLANDLGIPSSECHVAHFDADRCEKALIAILGWGRP